jgi:serine protease inhibitor
MLKKLALVPLLAALPAGADPKPSTDALVAADRDLTFDLAKKIAPNDNAVFSPASIQFALGMTFGGARGKTADEMSAGLHFDRAGGGGVHDLFAKLGASLATLDHGDKQAFHIVNRLFGQKSYDWNKSFLALTDKDYGAALEPVDFADSDNVRKHINSWIEDKTNKKIVDLLPPGSITGDTRLVLTNAVYFKGAWLHQFQNTATRDGDFFARGKGSVKVPMMSQNQQFSLGGTADAQILEMPYSQNDLAMDVILPTAKDGLSAVESKLDGAKLGKLIASLRPTQVDVALPKFKVRTSVAMKPLLEQLGIRKMFAPDADLSGMVTKPHERLWVDEVFHQGFVAVDEAGTEAAAATAVVITAEGVMIPPKATAFHADHPFVWLIRDLKTGEILFYGRIVDPR